MTKLKLLDQTFFKMEQGGLAPIYMGGVTIVDPTTAKKTLTAAELADHVAAIMEEVPLLRQKLVQDKLRIGSMRLVDDPDFDVRNHVNVYHLVKPGGYKELTDYLGTFSKRRINLKRPLWHVEVIDGLEQNRIAVAIRIHHGILDGVGAQRALGNLFSTSIKPPRTLREDAWTTEPEPSDISLIGSALAERIKGFYFDAPKFVFQNSGPILQTLTAAFRKRLMKNVNQFMGHKSDTKKVALPRIRKTSLNIGALSDHRAVAFAELPMDEIKSLRAALNCTVNDLALFINSWALDYYFKEIGEPLDFDLVSIMPIDSRGEGDQSAGNSVGISRVNLHNTISGAKARLTAIANDTQVIKGNAGRAQKPDGKRPKIELTALDSILSPIILEGLVQGINQFDLLEKAPPLANVVITNVPNASRPMYIAGARVVSSVPMAPCADTMALTITVTNTEDVLLFGYHGCGKAIRDKELLVEGARRGLVALKRRRRPKTTASKRKSTKKRG